MHLQLVVDGVAVSMPALAALGVVVGYVAGLFGVGGGFLLTPLLVVVFRIPLPTAVGTGLCQIVGTSLAALLRHRRSGLGELRFDVLMLPGSLVGVYAGTRALSALAGLGEVHVAGHAIAGVHLVVEPLYVALLVITAAMFLRRGDQRHEVVDFLRSGPLARVALGPGVNLPSVSLRNVSAIAIGYIGFGLGVLSGLLGIGGGIALMPVLIYGFGFPLRQAAGTGIVVLFASALLGTALHAAQGHVDLRLAMVLLVGATVSAQLGARATRKLPARVLRRMLAGVILLTAGAVVWDLLSRFA